jgi:hypothetical protein
MLRATFSLVVGLLASVVAVEARAQGGAPRRPTVGERITAQAEMKSAMRATARHEYQAQQQKQKALRSSGPQSFYRGPKGDVINSRDLPPGGQQAGYRYQGSVNYGQPQNWARPFRPQ